jgi:TPR repeat protein
MAYNEVAAYYLLHHAHHEFYFYALAMANRHQCAEAYYHLGYFLKSKTIIDSIDLTKPNSITDSLATYYFLKAYELGYESALYSLKDDFKMNRPSAKSYLAKLNQL